MKFLKKFEDFCEKKPILKCIKDSFLRHKNYPTLILGMGFILGVTEHVFITILIALSLSFLLAVFLPFRTRIYIYTGAAPSVYSDLMIWAFLASCLSGFWLFIYVDLTRLLYLYLGLLVVVCHEFQDVLDESKQAVLKNFGFGLKLGFLLCGICLIRFVGHYFLGAFSFLSGLCLSFAIYDWVIRHKAKMGKLK